MVNQLSFQTGGWDAEYGNKNTAIVNVATRSGTNAFHGEAFDYLRNNYFDARNFFNRKPGVMNSLRRNNFGGALSGPIWKNESRSRPMVQRK